MLLNRTGNALAGATGKATGSSYANGSDTNGHTNGYPETNTSSPDTANTDTPSQDTTLVRIHSCCLTGEILGSLRCDCGEQLLEAQDLLQKNNG